MIEFLGSTTLSVMCNVFCLPWWLLEFSDFFCLRPCSWRHKVDHVKAFFCKINPLIFWTEERIWPRVSDTVHGNSHELYTDGTREKGSIWGGTCLLTHLYLVLMLISTAAGWMKFAKQAGYTWYIRRLNTALDQVTVQAVAASPSTTCSCLY